MPQIHSWSSLISECSAFTLWNRLPTGTESIIQWVALCVVYVWFTELLLVFCILYTRLQSIIVLEASQNPHWAEITFWRQFFNISHFPPLRTLPLVHRAANSSYSMYSHHSRYSTSHWSSSRYDTFLAEFTSSIASRRVILASACYHDDKRAGFGCR